jgi:anti-sigma regulatory factor (Ser/Thr protein kinase)
MNIDVTRPTFRHVALFYDGPDDFVAQLVPFVRAGVDADEAVLVVLVRERLDLVRDALGDDARHVTFADMAAVGRNPARIIEAWADFVEANAHRRGVRGVGEPIYLGRTAGEISECHTHEALLNVAFEHQGDFHLVCPYDIATLEPDTVRRALRTHPLVLGRDGNHAVSDAFSPTTATFAGADALGAPNDAAEERAFDLHDMHAMRERVAGHARAAGFDEERVREIVVAANEIATNTVRHGGGHGRYRVWNDGNAIVCEITDRGTIAEPLAGRFRPKNSRVGGFGLWLANCLCDLVQIRSDERGTTVRLRAEH